MSADLERTPRALLIRDRSSFLEEKNRLSSQLQQLPLGYKVSLLLPDCSSAPSHLDAVFNSFNTFYLLRNMPIYGLLDPHFLQTAVYQGHVIGLSHSSRVDEDVCVALINGRLSLSLDKDSFEVLGFEGKPSRFNHRTNSRFVVSVDLTDRSMAPGGRSYQRLLTGLTSRLQLKTNFLLSHHPGGGASLQAILSSCDWSECRPEVSHRTLTHLSCPDLRSCDPHSVLEWLGAVDADVSSDNTSGSFLSSLICPDPTTMVSNALSVSVCGLLTPQDIQRLILQIRSHLESHLSWASLTVHGFVDSPVSWGGSEHGVLRGGDNFYNLLMFPDHTYHLHLATGAHDTCPS